ncbi:hypothetical protein D3C75_702790 [compost metagenome]
MSQIGGCKIIQRNLCDAAAHFRGRTCAEKLCIHCQFFSGGFSMAEKLLHEAVQFSWFLSGVGGNEFPEKMLQQCIGFPAAERRADHKPASAGKRPYLHPLYLVLRLRQQDRELASRTDIKQYRFTWNRNTAEKAGLIIPE